MPSLRAAWGRTGTRLACASGDLQERQTALPRTSQLPLPGAPAPAPFLLVARHNFIAPARHRRPWTQSMLRRAARNLAEPGVTRQVEGAHNMAGSAAEDKGGTSMAERVNMQGIGQKHALRQRALDDVRAALDKKEMLSEEMHSHLERLRADSAPESWDRLFFWLVSVREKALADQIASICRDVRLDMWKSVSNDEEMLSQLLPMCDQFNHESDASIASLRTKLGAMSHVTRGSFRPGQDMLDSITKMAKFGSTASDQMIRVIVEELYIRRGHHEQVCSLCAEILKFRGHDRHRMLSSTLVEDLLGAVLAEMRNRQNPDFAKSIAREFSPLRPYRGDSLRHNRLLGQCVKILERRARSLGLGVPPAHDGADQLARASALALGISERRQGPTPAEIARHVDRHYPLSHGFLCLGQPATAALLARPGLPLAQSILLAMTSHKLAGIRHTPHSWQNALATLEMLLGCKRTVGIRVGSRATKRWQAEMRGLRMWGCLLEMEMYLRLKMSGSDVATSSKVGGLPALELDGLHVEIYSALDDAWASGRAVTTQPADPVDALAKSAFGDSPLRDKDTPSGRVPRKVMVIADCPLGLFPDLAALKVRLATALESDVRLGAMFLLRRNRGRYAHAFLKNPSRAAQIPNSAKTLIEQALRINIANFANSGSRLSPFETASQV